MPYLGLCLGMQCAVMEFARHVVGLEGATSSEFHEDAKFPVIDLMPDQVDISDKGGTMRLGLYPCKLTEGTKAHEVYGQTSFTNAIAIAGNLTTNTVRKWSMPAWSCRARRRTTAW